MTNPFNDPVNYGDGEEDYPYVDGIEDPDRLMGPFLPDTPESFDDLRRRVDHRLVGRGTCVDEFEEREADAAMSRYEKGMGW